MREDIIYEKDKICITTKRIVLETANLKSDSVSYVRMLDKKGGLGCAWTLGGIGALITLGAIRGLMEDVWRAIFGLLIGGLMIFGFISILASNWREYKIVLGLSHGETEVYSSDKLHEAQIILESIQKAIGQKEEPTQAEVIRDQSESDVVDVEFSKNKPQSRLED